MLRLVIAVACWAEIGLGCHAGKTGSAVEAAFREASFAYAVPLDLLESTAWVLSGWQMHPPGAGADGGAGVMRLSGEALEVAARLTGSAPGLIQRDARANILGGAALLRELGDRVFAEEPHLDDRRPGDWWRAVALYPGFDSPGLGVQFAAEVYRAVRAGHEERFPDGSVLRLEASPAPPDYPEARWVPSGNFTGEREGRAIDLVIVHTNPGYAGTVAHFRKPSSGVSAHYLVQSADGEITQMVAEADTAWHAGNREYNQRSIGVEHTAQYTDEMYRASAALARWVCDRYAIPKDRRHIIGHDEVPDPDAPWKTGGTAGHRDPGAGWDWDSYMDLVLGRKPVQPRAEGVSGTVFSPRALDRDLRDDGALVLHDGSIAGARVQLSTSAATRTDANGDFSLDVPAGRYALEVLVQGYLAFKSEVTVPLGGRAQVWTPLVPELPAATAAAAPSTAEPWGPEPAAGSSGLELPAGAPTDRP